MVVSLNSRLESNKEEKKVRVGSFGPVGFEASREKAPVGERIFVELMTSNRKLKVSREGSDL